MIRTLIALLISIFANVAVAGPFVSGGMPGGLFCSDNNNEFQMKFIYLGPSVGVTGVQAIGNRKEDLSYACAGKYMPLPASPGTELYFVCNSKVNSDVIQIYYQPAVRKYSGLLISTTRNGVPNPTSLNCQPVHP